MADIGIPEIIRLIACAGALSLGGALWLRASRSPLMLPLGLLCLVIFLWNLAELGHPLSGARAWQWMDAACSPWILPLSFHVILAFVGQRRRFAWLLALAYALGLGLSLVALSAFGGDGENQAVASTAWSVAYLSAVALMLGLGVTFLVRHLRATSSPEEQLRCWLLLAGLSLFAALGSTELWAGLGLGIPRSGSIGSVVAIGFMGSAVFRLRLLESGGISSFALGAGALAAVAIAASALALHSLAPAQAISLFTLLAVLGILAVFSRRLLSLRHERGARSSQLATLGRFSQQLAHDLKNPLSAIKGAVQFLETERIQGRAVDPGGELLRLIGEQVERQLRTIDRYQRLGRIEAQLAPIRLSELLPRIVALQKPPLGIQLRSEIAGALPEVNVDADLLAIVLENLIQNAFEAMPKGGVITVHAQLSKADAPFLILSVEDDGAGMDARTRERAFDEFYTTKQSGSGLGLALVRRVIEAHRGEASIEPRLGGGTVVKLNLPLVQTP
jgi:two-component system, NtrC family, sensor histidine kinase HydH